MANNRMWIAHRPTGKNIPLGKRMGQGWYHKYKGDELAKVLTEFFDQCGDEFEHQDDFMLVLEDASGAPLCAEVVEFANPVEPVKFRGPK